MKKRVLVKEERRKRQMKNRTFRKIGSGILALVLVAALAVGFLPQSAGTAMAAAEATSDGNTTEDYRTSLGAEDSTEYAGRVWTDKTVYTGDAVFTDGADKSITVTKGENDFLVAYSALATSQSISGQTQVPIDVVFVIDLSGSMSNKNSGMDNGKSRIANTVAAVNASIEKLMAMNAYTRIAVVGYSNTAKTLLPLDHYEKRENSDFLSLDRQEPSGQYAILTYNAVGSTGVKHGSIEVEGGTNTQVGVYEGMNLLATEKSVTAEINGQTMNRVPSVILLSDGQATYSSDSYNWWGPGNNSGDGNGSGSYAGNGMKLMMTASYMKEAIDRNYKVTNAAYKTTVYTVGMGITKLSGDAKELAQTSLNPAAHLNDNNDMANTIQEAWKSYSQGGRPQVKVGSGWFDYYTFNHPSSNDITSIEYVDRYYDADDAESVTDVFDDIVGNITISTPQAPTEVTGDPAKDGYITYTDPIGQYMEVSDVKALIYAGEEFQQKETTTSGNTTTYVFGGKITSPIYGEQDVKNILIEVTKADDGMETLSVKIPAAAIPVRINTVELDSDGKVESHTNNGAYPIRVLYTVKATTDNGVNIDTLEGVTQEYIAANTVEGKVRFYSNLYTGENLVNEKTAGNATVEFKAASTNGYYIMQKNTPLYTGSDCTIRATANNVDSNEPVYFKNIYYEGTDEKSQVVTRIRNQFPDDAIVSDEAGISIKAGYPKFDNLSDFAEAKEPNTTATAAQYYAPTFVNTNPQDGHFLVYLGNNGFREVDALGKLAITKIVEASDGLEVPDNKEFTFKVTLKDKNGVTLTGGEYSYVVTAEDGTETTGTIRNEETLKLRNGETATLINLPAGAQYTVTEEASEGFTSTSKDAEGTIPAGTTAKAVFTNTYAVQPTTAVSLSGSKILDGETLEEGEFHFTIEALDNAPLGDGETDVANAAGTELGNERYKGSIELLKNVIYQKKGEYVYLIREQIPEQRRQGMTYDTSIYKVTVVVTDDSKGHLVASAPKIQKSEEEGLNYTDVSSVEFHNTYAPLSTTIVPLQLTKVLSGDRIEALKEGEFQFEMSLVEADPQDGIQLPENTVLSNDGNGVVRFGDITFTKPGTYVVQVKEVIPEENKVPGVTYDTHTVTTTFTVFDKKGQLDAERTGTTGDRTFTNHYVSEGSLDGEKSLKVTKELNGRDNNAWLDTDSFTFILSAANEQTKQAVASGDVVMPENAGGITISSQDELKEKAFGNIEIKKAGIYTFTISEDTTKKIPGVSYAEPKTVTITAVDQGDATLAITSEITDANGAASDLHFVNTYGAEETKPVDTSVLFTKSLTGRDWLGSDEFSFTLSKVSFNGSSDEEALKKMPMPKDESGAEVNTAVLKDLEGTKEGKKVSFGFGNLVFDQKGTYVYQVTENNLNEEVMPKVSKDTHTAILSITVTDDGEGKLQAVTPSITDGAFVNTYESSLNYSAQNGLRLTKVLNGRDMEKDQFTFTVKPKATVGSTTAEEAAAKLGLVEGANEFKNGAADAGKTAIIDILNGNSITFTQADAGKTYTYEVAEKNDAKEGYTYDKDVRTVTISVADDHKGTLTVTTTVTMDGKEVSTSTATTGAEASPATVAFENTYKAETSLGGEGNVVIEATKYLANRPLENGEFTFQVKDIKGNEVTTGTNDTNGRITFDSVTYNTDELNKDADAGIASKVQQGSAYIYTYIYTVSELQDGLKDMGVQGDEAAYNITVKVTDDGEGTLSIEVVYPEGQNGLVFNNVYGASDNEELTINGQKKLTSDPGTIAPNIEGMYTFKIEGSDGAPMPEKTEVQNDASGNVNFGKIEFTMENVFGDEGAASTDEDDALIPGDGTDVTDKDDAAAPDKTETGKPETDTTETETGKPETDTTETGKPETDKTETETGKSETDTTETETGKPETDTTETETGKPETDTTETETGKPETDKTETDKTEDAALETAAPKETALLMAKSGRLVNAKIALKDAQAEGESEEESKEREKTFTYTVTETGSVDGVVNDPESTKTFTITVKDDGKGHLSIAKKSWTDGVAPFTFENTYKVTPLDYSISTDLTVEKKLTGRTLKAGEFTFDLLDGENQVVASASNDEAGKVTFPAVTYTKPGVYTYTMQEKNDGKGGVSYDTRTYQVTVTVADDGKGSLTAKAETSEGESITFENTYAAQSASVVIGSSKVYKDGELKKDQFTFQLKDENGNLVSEAKNEANGQILFGALVFDKAGVYKYTISEKNDGQDRVDYDDTVYGITVTVTDDLEGHLTVAVAYDGGTPVFTNIYDKPEENNSDDDSSDGGTHQTTVTSAQTGDDANIAGFAALAAFAVIALIAILVYRRRQAK